MLSYLQHYEKVVKSKKYKFGSKPRKVRNLYVHNNLKKEKNKAFFDIPTGFTDNELAFDKSCFLVGIYMGNRFYTTFF